MSRILFMLAIISLPCVCLGADEIKLEKWIGRYEGVSRACINEPIIITKTTISRVEPTKYSECLNSPFDILEQSSGLLAIKILRSDCRFSNRIFTLTDQGSILVQGYNTQKGFELKDFGKDGFFYCVYHKNEH